jgi:hypothetical protein
MLSASKSRLHDLIDALPEQETIVAQRFLEFLIGRAGDPLLQAFLGAPEVDEPFHQDDLLAIAEAEQAISVGEVTSWEQVKAGLQQ